MPEGDRREFTVDVKDVAGQIVWRVTLSLVVERPAQGSRKHLTVPRISLERRYAVQIE